MNQTIFTDANFEMEVLKSDRPVLVDFYADWCGPCKMMSPIIEEVAAEIGASAKVGKLDVDGNQATAQKYGVLSIPTLIFFKDGKEVDKLVGVQDKDSLMEKLKKIV